MRHQETQTLTTQAASGVVRQNVPYIRRHAGFPTSKSAIEARKSAETVLRISPKEFNLPETAHFRVPDNTESQEPERKTTDPRKLDLRKL